jgi:hypothetical protein
MKANELRIGNYYMSTDGSWISQVTVNDLMAWSKGAIYGKEIPLTDEWLLKFGFQKIGANFRIMSKGFREFVLWFNHSSNCYEVKANNYFTEVKFIHNLQNIHFALTSEELIIK